MNGVEHDELLIRVDERTNTILIVLTDVHAELKKQNGRIGALERWQARILGAVGFAAIVAPVVALKGGDILKILEGG